MTTNKITYIDALNLVLNGETLTPEATEKLEALREQLIKRNASKSDKPSKKQAENAELIVQLAEAMKPITNPVTVSEIMATDPDGIGRLSNQKISALLKILEKEGKVIRTIDKRKAYFKLVVG